ncbi:MAG TPA: hypothetical protein DIT95_08825 [Arenibacter sp.]|nr:hypothetical protein [Arenibacter sp.]
METKTLTQVTKESISDWKVMQQYYNKQYSFFHHLINIKNDQNRIDGYMLIDVYGQYTREDS